MVQDLSDRCRGWRHKIGVILALMEVHWLYLSDLYEAWHILFEISLTKYRRCNISLDCHSSLLTSASAKCLKIGLDDFVPTNVCGVGWVYKGPVVLWGTQGASAWPAKDDGTLHLCIENGAVH